MSVGLPVKQPPPKLWEPTITNMVPFEELTKKVADFLYEQVVLVDDPQLVGDLPGGAQIEIEAKIGTFIDKNTNERLHLPVLTETVLDMRSPFLKVYFKSSMTEVR